MKCLIQKCILKCITNNCKPPQNFVFQKTELSFRFRFIWFEKFPYGFAFSLDGRMELIACLLFYLVIKMEVLRFCEKPYQTWQTSVKTLKKIKMHQQEHTNRVHYYYIDFQNTHRSLPHPCSTPFFEGGMKLLQNWVEGAILNKICLGNQKGEGRGNAKVVGRCDFFIFIFSLLAMMVINTVFKKFTLENIF